MLTLAEKRLDHEKRTGKAVRIYRAYPSIGRGSVIHDWISHDEVERRFEKALRISLWTRFKWWLGGNI